MKKLMINFKVKGNFKYNYKESIVYIMREKERTNKFKNSILINELTI